MSANKQILSQVVIEKSRANVVAEIRKLADAIESGKVALPQGQATVDTEVPELIRYGVKLQEKTRKDGSMRRKLEIELKWLV